MLEDIINFIPMTERLGTGGQPSRQQFQDIQNAGYEVVINLAMPDSDNAIPGEDDLVRGMGMDYIHLPVVWGAPDIQRLDAFFLAMKALKEHKVFVHCAKNMRVTAFYYLYQVLAEKIDEEEARMTMLQIWDPQDNPIWDEFIQEARKTYGYIWGRG